MRPRKKIRVVCAKKEETIASHEQLPKLPPEMWYHVFSFTPNSQDVENLTKVSHFFKNVIQPRKAVLLLDKVLPLLIDGGHLEGYELLTMRMVSAAWQNAIDNFIQKRPYVTPYDDSEYLRRITPRFATSSGETPYIHFNPTVKISNVEKMGYWKAEHFLTHYCALNYEQRNPFVGASVTLSMDYIHHERLQAMLQEVPTLIEKVGHHIKHLKIETSQFFPIELTYMLCNLSTKACVNLKSLFIFAPNYTVYSSQIMLNPQPALPHLESLEIYESSHQPVLLMRIFADPYLSQLKKLTLSSWYDVYCTAHFPNLKELKLDQITSNEILNLVLKFNAPIQKLTLFFTYEHISMLILHRVFKKFPLRRITMAWLDETRPFFTFIGSTPTEDLIPTVHTVIMQNSINVNYSFLTWFPNLQYITIRQTFPPGDYSLSMIVPQETVTWETVQIQAHLFTHHKSMYQSNVWKLLPKLKLITFFRRKERTQQQVAQKTEADVLVFAWKRGSLSVYRHIYPNP